MIKVSARRSVLKAAVAAGAVGVVGCSSPGERAAAPSPSAELRMRKQAARASGELMRRYDATVEAHPDLAEPLIPLRNDVAAHVTAFAGKGRDRKTASPSGKPGKASPSPTPAAPDVPDDPKKALARLAEAERSTADAHTEALAEAPGELARLLASVAAAGAGHAYVLAEVDA
nr:hypothetical protein [Streptomyces coryli]